MTKPSLKIDDLFNIFLKKNLIQLSKVQPRTPTKNKVNVINSTNLLTPFSKSIYDAVSPNSKQYILQDMLTDNDLIQTNEKLEEESDPDFEEKMENNRLGFYMEDFISFYGLCPVCNQPTLHKYAHSNVPAIDFVCINYKFHLNTKTCFLFQMKISLNNNYFNLTNESIVVGSRTYGNVIHSVKGSDPLEDKMIVPGYICIKLYQQHSELQSYNVDYRNSFILIPDYTSKSTDFYYTYLKTKSIYGKNMITWNNSMVKTLNLHKTIVDPIIVRYEVFNQIEITNPYKQLI